MQMSSGRLGCDRRDEPVAAPMQRFHKSRIVRIVSERRTKPLQGSVEAVLEIDERAGGPEPLAQLFARDQLTGPLEHHRQNFERLFLKSDADSTFAQLAGAQVHIERSEPSHIRLAL